MKSQKQQQHMQQDNKHHKYLSIWNLSKIEFRFRQNSICEMLTKQLVSSDKWVQSRIEYSPINEINRQILDDTKNAHTEVGHRQVGEEKICNWSQSSGHCHHQYDEKITCKNVK